MSYQKLAFIIGLFGSLHCIGMCGPLAMGIPSLKQGAWLLLLDKLLYQCGRVISYCLLGLMVGLIGRQLWMAGLQQGISIMSGLLIIMAATSRIFKLTFWKSSSWLVKPFTVLLEYALNHKANHLIVGMINGLLPCGFVYLALADALHTGSVVSAGNYMFWFGLGTVPLMLLATVGMGFTKGLFRRRVNRMIPYMMLCLGCWFVLRGMELDIPYLSPARAGTEISECK